MVCEILLRRRGGQNMKDYRLSEIKEICQKRNDCDNCDNCECGIFCSKIYTYVSLPNEWNDIILRDMIELPCKEHRVNRYGTFILEMRSLVILATKSLRAKKKQTKF